jgi:hypothetical protein
MEYVAPFLFVRLAGVLVDIMGRFCFSLQPVNISLHPRFGQDFFPLGHEFLMLEDHAMCLPA